jgi:hypothetical protein
MSRQTKAEIELDRYVDLPVLEKLVGRFGEDRTDLYHRLLRDAAGGDGAAGAAVRPGAPGAPPTAKRAARGSVTPAEAYIDPILRVLRAKPNFSAPSEQVVQDALRGMKGILNAVDLEPLPRNARVIRAVNKAQWARQLMVQQGLLQPKSRAGFGTWALTTEGIKRAKKLS